MDTILIIYTSILTILTFLICIFPLHDYIKKSKYALYAISVTQVGTMILLNAAIKFIGDIVSADAGKENMYTNPHYILCPVYIFLTCIICFFMKLYILPKYIIKKKKDLNPPSAEIEHAENAMCELENSTVKGNCVYDLSYYDLVYLFYGFSIQFFLQQYFNTKEFYLVSNLVIGGLFQIVGSFSIGISLTCSSLNKYSHIVLSLLYTAVTMLGVFLRAYNIYMNKYWYGILSGTSIGFVIYAIIFEIILSPLFLKNKRGLTKEILQGILSAGMYTGIIWILKSNLVLKTAHMWQGNMAGIGNGINSNVGSNNAIK